jgi:hypothetical protein
MHLVVLAGTIRCEADPEFSMMDSDAKPFYVMLGSGTPYMQPALIDALQQHRFTCLYAVSDRVAVEDPTTGVKKSTFKHLGFYRV